MPHPTSLHSVYLIVKSFWDHLQAGFLWKKKCNFLNQRKLLKKESKSVKTIGFYPTINDWNKTTTLTLPSKHTYKQTLKILICSRGEKCSEWQRSQCYSNATFKSRKLFIFIQLNLEISHKVSQYKKQLLFRQHLTNTVPTTSTEWKKTPVTTGYVRSTLVQPPVRVERFRIVPLIGIVVHVPVVKDELSFCRNFITTDRAFMDCFAWKSKRCDGGETQCFLDGCLTKMKIFTIFQLWVSFGADNTDDFVVELVLNIGPV